MECIYCGEECFDDDSLDTKAYVGEGHVVYVKLFRCPRCAILFEIEELGLLDE